MRRAGVDVLLDASGFSSNLEVSKEVESTLVRVTQEALSNCVNHSRAKAVSVCLESENGHIRLHVADDGHAAASYTRRRPVGD